MPDLTFIVADVGILTAGTLFGRFVIPKRRGPKPPKPLRPICGCDHHFGHHGEDGVCRFVETIVDTVESLMLTPDGKVFRDGSGRYKFVEEQVIRAQIPCTCQRYTGPEPLPTYTSEMR